MINQNNKTPMAATVGVLNTDHETIGSDLNNGNCTTFEPPVQLTKVKAYKPECLSKRFFMKNGKLEKKGSGQLIQGEYEVLRLYSFQELQDTLANLQLNETLIYGVPQWVPEQGRIASSNTANQGELTRTRENFTWPHGSAILFLDYDPPARSNPITAESLWEKIIAICPRLSTAPAIIMSSASGFLYDSTTNEELKGAGGWHIYIIVKDGRDIPRAGKALYDMGWLGDCGRYDISAAGTLLERSLVDGAVWQPERLDFAAGANCEHPLEQRRPEPLVMNPAAEPFDTTQIHSVPDSEKLKQIKAFARGLVKEDAEKKRAAWIESRVDEGMRNHPEADPEKRDEKKKKLRSVYSCAAEDKILMGDFVLQSEEGSLVTVGELLDDAERWHGKRFADPLEPKYRHDNRTAIPVMRSQSPQRVVF